MCFNPRPNQHGWRVDRFKIKYCGFLDRARITVLETKTMDTETTLSEIEHSAGCRHYLERTRTQYLRNTVVIKLDGARSTVLQPNTVVTLTVQEHGIKNQIYQP